MFNVTVLKMRDIIKYLVGIVLTLVLVIFSARFFSSKNLNEKQNKIKIKKISMGNMTTCLNEVIPCINNNENKILENGNTEIKQNNKGKILENILNTEISSIKMMSESEKEKVENSEINETVSIDNTNEIEKIDTTNKQTEVVTQNPIKDNSNVQYGSVKIKNETSYELTEDILKPDIKIDNKNIVIFHTHTCESYTESEKYKYNSTGNYRTTDLNYSVARVGDELEKYLKSYNLNVIHNKTYHDYPSYNGSYTRALQTVQNILKENPSDIVIDLHRDAIGSRPDYAPTVKIGDEYAAQIMFVIGTNDGGMWHPNWQQNLKFAVKVQEKANEMYPGLFKTMMVTKSRYNQHTSKYANIIEVGATGNTLEQTLTSMKYLASVFNEVLK